MMMKKISHQLCFPRPHDPHCSPASSPWSIQSNTARQLFSTDQNSNFLICFACWFSANISSWKCEKRITHRLDHISPVLGEPGDRVHLPTVVDCDLVTKIVIPTGLNCFQIQRLRNHFQNIYLQILSCSTKYCNIHKEINSFQCKFSFLPGHPPKWNRTSLLPWRNVIMSVVNKT